MENLNRAFRELRKRGYLARQSFGCCGNCAGHSLTHEAVKLVDAGKTVRGAVFYHKQDTEHFKARHNKEGKLMIRFGDLDSTEKGVIGIGSTEIGKEVVAVFKSCGIRTKWDGNSSSCIEAYPSEPKT